ncbi:MAG: hypothetical protein LBK94_04865 [Prevotellaceae bacterium]|jgi:hypothetical protein|nr:hypothetical protein [Prevotellaceae bacterium]
MKKTLVAIAVSVIALFAAQNANGQEQSSGKYYKENYSTGFSCWIRTTVSGGGIIESIIACKTGDYAKGYEDGYAGNKHKYLAAAVIKLWKNSQLLISDSSTAPSTMSASQLSYNQGYIDGEKDKKKEGR